MHGFAAVTGLLGYVAAAATAVVVQKAFDKNGRPRCARFSLITLQAQFEK